MSDLKVRPPKALLADSLDLNVRVEAPTPKMLARRISFGGFLGAGLDGDA